jgi:hypothetical protein
MCMAPRVEPFGKKFFSETAVHLFACPHNHAAAAKTGGCTGAEKGEGCRGEHPLGSRSRAAMKLHSVTHGFKEVKYQTIRKEGCSSIFPCSI